MEARTLEDLQALLGGLPKNQAKTASFAWDEIRWAAEQYLKSLAEEPESKRRAPWEIERDLSRLASTMKDLASKLQHVSDDVLREVENEANYFPLEIVEASWQERTQYRLKNPRCADPFAWFEIGRYSFDSDGVPEPEEPWGGHDGMRPIELVSMAQFLENFAHKVANRKAEKNGARKLTSPVKAKQRAKALLVSNLDFGITIWHDRPKTHVLPVVQIVHRWATGDAVGEEWGKTELDRHRHNIEHAEFPQDYQERAF